MKVRDDTQAETTALGQQLLQQWAQAPLEPWPPILDQQAQLSAVSGALGRVAERRRRESQRSRVLGALALAASVGGLVFGGWTLWGPGESLQATAPVSSGKTGSSQPELGQPATRPAVAQAGVRLRAGAGANTEINGVASPLSVGSQVPEGAVLALGSQAAELRFESGSSARFDAQTRVQLVSARGGVESLFLARGGTEVEVPPKGRPVEFSVETTAARVVVHGTRFSVQVHPETGQTLVEVTRGRVSVHPQQGGPLTLVAGGRWQSPLGDLPESSEGVGSEPLADSGREPTADSGRSPAAEKARKRRAGRRSRPSRQPRRTLGAENDLFSRAMALKGQGDDRGSLELLQDFEQRFPQSLLSQEVCVEHFRVLASLGRQEAAAEVANEYMRRWPRGFAREEARNLLLGAP